MMLSKNKALFYVLLPSLAAVVLLLLCHLPSCHGDTRAYKWTACNATIGECNESEDEFLSGLGGMIDANLAANPLGGKYITYRTTSKDAIGKSSGPARAQGVKTYRPGCRSNYNCKQSYAGI